MNDNKYIGIDFYTFIIIAFFIGIVIVVILSSVYTYSKRAQGCYEKKEYYELNNELINENK